MRNIKYLFFILLLIIPFMVSAKETCDPNSIKIDSITLEETTGTITEGEGATFEGNDINLNLKMRSVGDNAKYKIVITNTSGDDFEVSEDSLNISTDYVGYTITSSDGSLVVKAGESKTFYLVAKYENEVPEELLTNDSYSDNQNMVVGLSNNPKESTTENKEEVKAIENPNTSTSITIIAIVIIVGILCMVFMKHKLSKYVVLVLGLLIIPYCVYAICKCELKIASKVTIEKPYTGIIYRNDEFVLGIGDSIYPAPETKICTYVEEYDELDCSLPSDIDTIEMCESYLDTHTDEEYREYYSCVSRSFPALTYALNSSEITTSNYLKHEVEDGVVVKSYLCNKDYGDELCVEYGLSYETNKGLIGSFFTNHGGTCNEYHTDYYHYNCPINGNNQNPLQLYDSGYIVSGSCRAGSTCTIDANGKSSCDISDGCVV